MSEYNPADHVAVTTDHVEVALLIGEQLREFDDLPDWTLAVLLVAPRGLGSILHTERIPLDAAACVAIQRLMDRLTGQQSLEAALRGLAYRIHGCADLAAEVQAEEEVEGSVDNRSMNARIETGARILHDAHGWDLEECREDMAAALLAIEAL